MNKFLMLSLIWPKRPHSRPRPFPETGTSLAWAVGTSRCQTPDRNTPPSWQGEAAFRKERFIEETKGLGIP